MSLLTKPISKPLSIARKDPVTRHVMKTSAKLYNKTIGKTPIGRKLAHSKIGRLFGLSKKRVWVIVNPDKGLSPSKSLLGKTNVVTQRSK